MTTAPSLVGGARAGQLSTRRLLAVADLALADVAFVAFLAIVLLARWSIVQPLPLPSGADGGNWLALGRSLAGEPMPGHVVYPPLVPALALIAERLGQPILGLKLIAVFGSVVPAAGCYLATRIMGLRWRGAIPCAFLALAGSVGEAAAWGGYPQLLGLGLMAVALALLDRTLRTWHPATALLAGVAVAAALSANELVGAVLALSAVLLVAAHVLLLGSRPPSVLRMLAAPVLAVAPSLALEPVYAQLLSAVFSTRGARPVFADIAIRDLLPYLYRDVRAFWYPVQALAVVVPAVLLVHRRSRAWPLPAAVLVAAVVMLVGLRQTRFGYVLPVAATIALAVWLDAGAAAAARGVRVATALLAVALLPVLAYQAQAGTQLFRQQVAFYGSVVPGDWVPVLSFLREGSPPGSLVAVAPDERLDPTGWWVQGLADRPALISSDPAWLNFPDERARAETAAGIFDPRITAAESLRRARAAGVGYLLVDKRWPHYAVWRRGGLPIVMDEPDVVLVRV